MEEMQNNQTDDKSLKERVAELVDALEKARVSMEARFSLRRAFLRGVAQGLGIILGSTIVAGVLYAVAVKFVSPELIQKYMIDSVVERSLQEKK